MTISVIIPAWNRAHYLSQALNSALAQTRAAQEIIVADDGSTDETQELLKTHFPKVKSLILPHAGPAAARNAAIRASTGSYVAFLDSDDIWTPEKLARQSQFLREDPSADLVYGRYREFRENEDPTSSKGQIVAGYFAGTLLVHRRVFDCVGLFDETLLMGEFIEWGARVLDGGFLSKMVPEILLWRRVHAGNLTRPKAGPSRAYALMIKRVLERRRSKA